jgi:curved DNA-binding protein CbpA
MSSNKIEINFESLKYNLYDLLGLKKTDSIKRVKKRYRKLILEYHPDKTEDFDEEVFNHLTLASQILTNEKNRKKYDDYIAGPVDDFVSMKKSSHKNSKEIKYMPKEKKNSYKDRVKEMNQKHGYVEDYSALNSGEIMKEVNKKKTDRGKLSIKYEDIRGKNDFNDKFSGRKKGGKMDQQIIEYKSGDLTSFQLNSSNQGYVGLEHMDNLYLEGESLQTDRYSTLDRAFGLYQNPDVKDDASLEDKMRNYEMATDQYREMKPKDFTKKKWVIH